MENTKNINRIPIKITERTLNNNNKNKEIIYIDKTNNNNNNLKINQGEEVKKIETSFNENSFSENKNNNKIKTGPHIVKIRVNPSLSPQSSSSSSSSTTTRNERNDDDKRYEAEEPVRSCISSSPLLEEIRTTLPSTNNSDFHQSASNTVRINIGETSNQVQSDMVPTPTPLPPNNTTTYYYYNHQNDHEESSSQNDSGTCSDLDSGKGSPITIKNKRNTSIKILNNDNPSLKMSSKLINNDCNISLISDEDEVSCDSLNSSNEEYENHVQNNKTTTTKIVDFTTKKQHQNINNNNTKSGPIIEERTYEDRRNTKQTSEKKSEEDTLNENNNNYDSYYKFHLNENNFNENGFLINGECSVKSECSVKNQEDDTDHFAGCRSYQDGAIETSTIKSSKGTIRGVKNRVRAGIATFLQIHATKTWQEKEAGQVVVYTTTMGVIRETYQRCLKVKQILRTHLVKFDEKDVFMSRETQTEIKERMSTDNVVLPQVFVEGQHIGDAETIDRLNESGELRRILKPYKSLCASLTCEVCGGYKLLPCPFCNGSKKSVHRNHFTTELVALKCMHCDEVGLTKCYAC